MSLILSQAEPARSTFLAHLEAAQSWNEEFHIFSYYGYGALYERHSAISKPNGHGMLNMNYMMAAADKYKWPRSDFERSLILPLYSTVLPGPKAALKPKPLTMKGSVSEKVPTNVTPVEWDTATKNVPIEEKVKGELARKCHWRADEMQTK